MRSGGSTWPPSEPPSPRPLDLNRRYPMRQYFQSRQGSGESTRDVEPGSNSAVVGYVDSQESKERIRELRLSEERARREVVLKEALAKRDTELREELAKRDTATQTAMQNRDIDDRPLSLAQKQARERRGADVHVVHEEGVNTVRRTSSDRASLPPPSSARDDNRIIANEAIISSERQSADLAARSTKFEPSSGSTGAENERINLLKRDSGTRDQSAEQMTNGKQDPTLSWQERLDLKAARTESSALETDRSRDTVLSWRDRISSMRDENDSQRTLALSSANPSISSSRLRLAPRPVVISTERPTSHVDSADARCQDPLCLLCFDRASPSDSSTAPRSDFMKLQPRLASQVPTTTARPHYVPPFDRLRYVSGSSSGVGGSRRPLYRTTEEIEGNPKEGRQDRTVLETSLAPVVLPVSSVRQGKAPMERPVLIASSQAEPASAKQESPDAGSLAAMEQDVTCPM